MKLIINASNLNGGGGVQVGFSFINECINFAENEYHVFLCPQISNQIDLKKFPQNFTFYHFQYPVSFSIKGIEISRKLTKLEELIKPDCVFSVFGPSYWTPKSIHLMGFAIPHFLYLDSPFYKIITFKEKLKWKFLYFLKKRFFLRNAKYYHIETEDARIRLAKYLNCSIDKIFKVSNTFSAVYNNVVLNDNKILYPKKENCFRFICISAYYNHKNLEILNRVIPLLKAKGLDTIEFVLTIDSLNFESIFSTVSKTQIINIGRVKIEDCPQLYSECDAVFLPTLLECFSANYPEAMKMEKPVLTSDLPFARDICADAAMYFKPLNEEDIVNNIIQLINSKDLQSELIKKGKAQLLNFNSASERAALYLKICNMISIKD